MPAHDATAVDAHRLDDGRPLVSVRRRELVQLLATEGAEVDPGLRADVLRLHLYQHRTGAMSAVLMQGALDELNGVNWRRAGPGISEEQR